MLNELAGRIHEIAILHGWWKTKRALPEVIALCHSELSEALEEYRNYRPMDYRVCRKAEKATDCTVCAPDIQNRNCPAYCETCEFRGAKPEGVAIEMADCLIRILDYLASESIDIDYIVAEKMEFNKTRPMLHGGKRC